MEAAKELEDGESTGAVAAAPSLKLATPESAPPLSKPRSESRLPQRRKFDRYSQPPLKGAVISAGVLAK